jgi:hypothetical protein
MDTFVEHGNPATSFIVAFYTFAESVYLLQSFRVCCLLLSVGRHLAHVCPTRNGRRDHGCLPILASFATVNNKFLSLLKHHCALRRLSSLLTHRPHHYCLILHLSYSCRMVTSHLLEVVSSEVNVHLTPRNLTSCQSQMTERTPSDHTNTT